MGLKSRRWFEANCFEMWRSRGSSSQLANRALELAFGVDNTQGHILQAIGAVQKFYDEHHQYIRTVQSSPFVPFKMSGNMMADWLSFIKVKTGHNGRRDFNYNWDYFKNALTTKYGGNTSGGGGGDNEFEIVLRLMAEFI